MLGAVILMACLGVQQSRADAPAATWKAGIARADITPEGPVWMGGYASRDHPAEGTMHPLWVKVLALEDAAGRRAVLVTSDLIGFPQNVSAHIRDRLKEELGLARAQVMLTSSHTHSGPLLREDYYAHPLGEREQAKVVRYVSRLEDRVVAAVAEAFEKLAPAHLSSGMGVARFAVNRRNNDEGAVLTATALAGPIDHAVPVLKVEGADERLLAIVFGYACHATTLSGYEWSGDWPGFAQIELEEAHPEATALFVAGAGADQNPLPRRSTALAKQYGRALAAAVDRVLEEPMTGLAPELTTRYEEIDLRLSAPPGQAELREMAETGRGYHRHWAERLLREREQGQQPRTQYPYPIQVWRLGDQAVVALGGEVVVDYTIMLRRLLGPGLFVFAYANDVMGYIPSVRVLREGGYEGAGSQRVYGLPSTWAPDVEARIVEAVLRLATSAGAVLPSAGFE